MEDIEYYQKNILRTPDGSDGLSLFWMGTAGIAVTDGETGFVIDPYVSRQGILKVFLGCALRPDNEYIDEWLKKIGIADLEAVIVSHSHFDHLLDAPAFAEKTGAQLVGSRSTCWAGQSHGLPEDQISTASGRDRYSFGDFSITFLTSEHGPAFLGRVPFPGEIGGPMKLPASAYRYRLGETFSLLIEHPAGKIIHHGSAGFRRGMYDDIEADVVLLGIAGRSDTVEYLNAVPRQVKAKLCIPVHFDNFFQPLDKEPGVLRSARMSDFWHHATGKNYNFHVRTLPLGTWVTLPRVTSKSDSTANS